VTSHDELLDSVGAYALGVLPPREAAAVAEHLRTCETCRDEYALLRPAVTGVAYSEEACASAATGATAVSPLLKARIMGQVRGDLTATRRPVLWPVYAFAAACLVFAIVAGAYDVVQNRQIAEYQRLASATAYPFRFGNVLVAGNTVYVAARDLVPLPNGKVYQMWTLARGAARVAPSITFTPDKNGAALIAVPVNAGNTQAVAISVEPAGGSSSPTTTPIAFIKLGS
jgi:anti-sigma-K factor RskA